MSVVTTIRGLAAGLAILLLGSAAGAAPPTLTENTFDIASAAPDPLVEQHVLAMHATSIALDTEILESQLQAFVGLLIYGADHQCHALSGGGSIMVPSAHHDASLTEFGGQIQIFFDATCQALFMDETVDFTVSGTSYNSSPVVTVYSRAGRKVGTLKFNDTVSSGGGKINVIGLGTFTPKNGGSKLTVGLSCQIPLILSASRLFASRDERIRALLQEVAQPRDSDIACSGGVAQSFPMIQKSIAALTPITLHLTTVGGDTSVTFKQTAAAQVVTGAMNALNLKFNPRGKLVITGKQTVFGLDTFGGRAALLTLFPPKPTKWFVADVQHRAMINIALASDVTRKLTGAITGLTGRPVLATLTVDQSGTGSITYSNHKTVAIQGWDVTN